MLGSIHRVEIVHHRIRNHFRRGYIKINLLKEKKSRLEIRVRAQATLLIRRVYRNTSDDSLRSMKICPTKWASYI